MTNSNKLKPCPFCGEIPNLWTHRGKWAVDCESKDCISPGTSLCDTEASVITMWNTRSKE